MHDLHTMSYNSLILVRSLAFLAVFWPVSTDFLQQHCFPHSQGVLDSGQPMVSFTVVADKYYTTFVGGRSHQASPKDMPSSEAFQT